MSNTNQNLRKYLTIINHNECKNFIPEDEMLFNFPYILDSFQNEGMYRIHNGENLLVCCPTGSGKTSFALYAIAKITKFIFYRNFSSKNLS